MLVVKAACPPVVCVPSFAAVTIACKAFVPWNVAVVVVPNDKEPLFAQLVLPASKPELRRILVVVESITKRFSKSAF